MYYLCYYHNNDLEYYGMEIGFGKTYEPQITCTACQKYFSKEEIEEYKNNNFKQVIVLKRKKAGYPSTLHVVLKEGEEVVETPKGFIKIDKKYMNPKVVCDNNTIITTAENLGEF